MKINAYELKAKLPKLNGHAYWVSGDEHLLVSECAAQIQAHLNPNQTAEVLKLNVDKSFEPGDLLSLTANNSLFCDQQLVLITLNEKWPTSFAQTLETCLKNSGIELQFIICGPRLSSQQTRAKWYKALDASMVFVPIWPIDAHDLPNWLTRRAKTAGFNLHKPAAHFIAEMSEGNLLASAQALEKLTLDSENHEITLAQAENSLSDTTHYDVYNLIEACWQGYGDKALKIYHSLKAQQTEPTIILWVFCQEVRNLMTLLRKSKTTPLPQLFKEMRIFPKRQGPINSALKRLNLSVCAELLQMAAKVDRQIKGVEAGNASQTLQMMLMKSS